jgi:hypothetical protein
LATVLTPCSAAPASPHVRAIATTGAISSRSGPYRPR